MRLISAVTEKLDLVVGPVELALIFELAKLEQEALMCLEANTAAKLHKVTTYLLENECLLWHMCPYLSEAEITWLERKTDSTTV